MSCLFCRIIKREIPAAVVFEDEQVIAINDINPQAPTHLLIIPKRHIETLNDLVEGDDALVGSLFRRAAAIAAERGFAATGYRTVFNTNRDAGQTVFHIHLHLLSVPNKNAVSANKTADGPQQAHCSQGPGTRH